MGDGKKVPWTKGPWEVAEGEGQYLWEVRAPNEKAKARRMIARPAGPDRLANARLIAAAPALAEAALPFEAFIDVWLTMFGTTPKSGTIYSINSGAGSIDLTVEHFLAIRAALSLARGEEG